MTHRREPTERESGLTQVKAEPWRPVWPAEPALPRTLPRPPFDGLAAALTGVGWMIRSVPLARLAFPVGIAVLSRLYSAFLLSLVPFLQPDSPIPRISGYHDTFLQWDAQWYVMIANTGYHAAPMQAGPFGGRHDFAFFPGWPTMLRELQSIFGIQATDIAAPLANVLFVVAAVLMFVVMERALGSRAARWGIVLLAFSPAAYVLSLAYSEPLFLVFAGASFAMSTSRLRPLAAAAAMMTRVTGVGIAVGAGVTWLRNRRDWTSLATAIAVGLAFAAWWTFIWALTGNPMGWFQGSAQWSHQLGLSAIGDAIWHLDSALIGDAIFTFFMLGAAVLLLRRNLELGLYSVIAIGLSIVGAPVSSMPRHVLVAFPAFGLVADRLGPRWSLALVILFALVQANEVWLSFVAQPPLAP